MYGPSVAKELIEFQLTDDQYQFKVEGHVTNVNYSVKKLVFLLFINHRLVESAALKKCIDNVYASYLPKVPSYSYFWRLLRYNLYKRLTLLLFIYCNLF